RGRGCAVRQGTVAGYPDSARRRGVGGQRVRAVAAADRSRGVLGACARAFRGLGRRRGARDGDPIQLSRCRVVAVTRGRDGVSWYQDGHLKNLAAYPVDVIDTTGTGDVFHGAYAFAIGGGLAVRDAMSFAAAAAALKCIRPGGRAGIPTIDDCVAFMRNY